jgi:hypothetical protein
MIIFSLVIFVRVSFISSLSYSPLHHSRHPSSRSSSSSAVRINTVIIYTKTYHARPIRTRRVQHRSQRKRFVCMYYIFYSIFFSKWLFPSLTVIQRVWIIVLLHDTRSRENRWYSCSPSHDHGFALNFFFFYSFDIYSFFPFPNVLRSSTAHRRLCTSQEVMWCRTKTVITHVCDTARMCKGEEVYAPLERTVIATKPSKITTHTVQRGFNDDIIACWQFSRLAISIRRYRIP